MAQTHTVGLPGDELRSDLRVGYTPGNDPLEIDVQSKVEALFGESLKKQAESVCKELSVSTGRLTLEDFGALPFVVAARVEAVLKNAHPEIEQESLPPMEAFGLYATTRDRLRRSRLYVPGNQPKLMLNAGIHKPDGLILDMEDSVPPSEKSSTRFIVRNALRSVDFFGTERMVRINQGDVGLEDLAYLVAHNVHLILVPKVESGAQIETIDRRIDALRGKCGRKEPVYLMPIIESARGVLKALEIAEASPNIVALAIGAEDYTADLGAERSREGRETFFARNMIVNAARAAGVQAIDTVFSDVADIDGLSASVAEAKSLGFDGKGCIHPRQIQPIHEGFAPSRSEIDKAKKIVRAFDEATAKGLGVVSIGSKMIDPPVVKRAQHTLELAVASGSLSPQWKEAESGT
jgi:citrate lyase subunit beta/citryl-CoA lyase